MEDLVEALLTEPVPVELAADGPDPQQQQFIPRAIQFEFLTFPSENADIIKLYDASGREFLTNLRTSDVQYLLKQTYLNNLKASMLAEQKMKARAKNGSRISALSGKNVAAKHQRIASSKLESVLHRALPSSFQNDYNFLHAGGSAGSSSNAGVLGIPARLDVGAWGMPNPIPQGNVVDRLKCEESFSSGEDYITSKFLQLPDAVPLSPSFPFQNQISYANLEKSFPPALTVAGIRKKPKQPKQSKKLTVRIKLPKMPSSSPSKGRGSKKERGKRCRKVYGNAHRDKWCRMCQWKKSCERFSQEEGGDDDDDEDSARTETNSSPNRSFTIL